MEDRDAGYWIRRHSRRHPSSRDRESKNPAACLLYAIARLRADGRPEDRARAWDQHVWNRMRSDASAGLAGAPPHVILLELDGRLIDGYSVPVRRRGGVPRSCARVSRISKQVLNEFRLIVSTYGCFTPLKNFVVRPDGRELAMGCLDGSVLLLDAETGRQSGRLLGHRSHVHRVRYSPDGATLASASCDGTVRIWSVASAKQVSVCDGEMGEVLSIAFDPTGRWIVTGSVDYTVRIWDASFGREESRFTGHRSVVLAVAFSPDGKRVASGSRDWTARIWEVGSGNELTRFEGHRYQVTGIAFSRDGERVVSCLNDSTIRIWDAFSGRELAQITGLSKNIDHVCFAADDSTVLCSGGDGTILGQDPLQTLFVQDSPSDREMARFEWHTYPVHWVAFNEDGSRVASQDTSGRCLVWDVVGRSRVRGLTPAQCTDLFRRWEALGGPMEPTWLPDHGSVVLAEEIEWRTAWYDPEKGEHGLPRKVERILDLWERNIGLRANLDTGAIEPVSRG